MEVKTDYKVSTLVEITPEMAKELLKKNINNRPLRKSNIAFLTNEILSGNWEATGTPICFDIDGHLVNGQHRLKAIIEANIPIKEYILGGFSKEAYHKMDGHQPRSASDILHTNGWANSNTVAAVVKFIMVFLENPRGLDGGNWNRKISNKDVLDFASDNEELATAINYTVNFYVSGDKILSKKIMGGLFYLFAEKDLEETISFFKKLTTGIELEKNDPVFILRKRLLKIKIDRVRRVSITYLTVLTVKAWNLKRSKKKVTKLQFNIEKDKIPEII